MGWLTRLFSATGEGAAKPIEAVGNVFDRLFTSEEERLQAQAVLEKLRQHPDELQIELNKVEAVSTSVFVAGWRPAIGWVCAMSLAVYYVPRFILGTTLWTIACITHEPMTLLPMPDMDISDVMGLVGAMLGMSWLRTSEKKAGVAR